MVSSWRLAFPGSSHAPPAPSCWPRSSSKSSQTPQGLPRLFPHHPFSHQQETNLWPSFRYSSLRRQNSNLPPPRSLERLCGRTQRRTFADTTCPLTKVAREWVPGGHQQSQGVLQDPCREHSKKQHSKPRWCVCLYTQMQRNYEIVTSFWRMRLSPNYSSTMTGSYRTALCLLSYQWSLTPSILIMHFS